MRGRTAIVLAAALALSAGGAGASAEARSHHAVPHASTTLTVWFKRSARLWFTKRTAATANAPVRTAVRALLQGPDGAESAAGVKTAIPVGAALLSTSVSRGVATVNVRPTFAAPAPKKRIRVRLAQLTYMATQFPNVHAVHLEFNGSAVASIGGVQVPAHMRRADFRRLLPKIVVHGPLIGATLPSTLHASGTSNVFEAAMVIKVLNAGGHRIARKIFTASCGSGCRGKFGVAVTYHVGHVQNGTIVITDTAATSGPPPNIVRIPVRLSP